MKPWLKTTGSLLSLVVGIGGLYLGYRAWRDNPTPTLVGEIRYVQHRASPLYVQRYEQAFNIPTQPSFQTYVRAAMASVEVANTCINTIHSVIADKMPDTTLTKGITHNAYYHVVVRNEGSATATNVVVKLPHFVSAMHHPGNEPDGGSRGPYSASADQEIELDFDLKPTEFFHLYVWDDEPPTAAFAEKIRVIHDRGVATITPMTGPVDPWTPRQMVNWSFSVGFILGGVVVARIQRAFGKRRRIQALQPE